MHITKLHLTNFRNYAAAELQPDRGLNLITGGNGQGKSAILEAAYLLATTKSHRTSRDSDVIKIGSDWARVAAEVDREERGDVLLDITLMRGAKKGVRINRVKHEKVGDIVGQLNAVIFSSADIDMVKGEPAGRRRFLNLEISQVSPQYVYALGRYKRVLEQRNAVLREGKPGRPQALEAWDEQLVQYGSILMEKRLVFLRRLSEMAQPVYSQLCGGAEELQLAYEPGARLRDPKTLEDIRTSFRVELTARAGVDLARGATMVGPHRDEVVFRVNGLDVRCYGSQGEQRSVALAVKLAEIALVEEMVGETPLALLDDVASELDEDRRSHIFDLVAGRCQVLLTATSAKELPDEVVSAASKFTVEAGTVRKI